MKKSPLTFQDIAPMWNMKTRSYLQWRNAARQEVKRDSNPFNMFSPKPGQKVFPNQLYIGNYATCIVGEAHKFSQDYSIPVIALRLTGISTAPYCQECTEFADQFYKCVVELWNKSMFEKLKTEFVEHWNETHVNKRVRKKRTVRKTK